MAFAEAFKIARWAVSGKRRLPWEELERLIALGIGMWLESSGKESAFGGRGTSEALLAWYCEEVGRPLAKAHQRFSRNFKLALIGLALLLAVSVLLWAVGLAR
jgi:hypothetical protein